MGSAYEPVHYNTVCYQKEVKFAVLMDTEGGLAEKHSFTKFWTFTYLPVFRALFGDSHSIVQSNDTTGFLQIFHAASESRRRNVKSDQEHK